MSSVSFLFVSIHSWLCASDIADTNYSYKAVANMQNKLLLSSNYLVMHNLKSDLLFSHKVMWLLQAP